MASTKHETLATAQQDKLAEIRTDDTATERELRDLFDLEPDQELSPCVPVCAGEWRAEGDRWRFFAYGDF